MARLHRQSADWSRLLQSYSRRSALEAPHRPDAPET